MRPFGIKAPTQLDSDGSLGLPLPSLLHPSSLTQAHCTPPLTRQQERGNPESTKDQLNK